VRLVSEKYHTGDRAKKELQIMRIIRTFPSVTALLNLAFSHGYILTSQVKKSPSGRLACKVGEELPDLVVI